MRIRSKNALVRGVLYHHVGETDVRRALCGERTRVEKEEKKILKK